MNLRAINLFDQMVVDVKCLVLVHDGIAFPYCVPACKKCLVKVSLLNQNMALTAFPNIKHKMCYFV